MSYHHPVEISANVAFLLRITSPHFPCRTALFLLILSIPDCSWGSLGSASHVKANELAPRQHKLLLVLSSQGYVLPHSLGFSLVSYVVILALGLPYVQQSRLEFAKWARGGHGTG
jgi:hypothetical protein